MFSMNIDMLTTFFVFCIVFFLKISNTVCKIPLNCDYPTFNFVYKYDFLTKKFMKIQENAFTHKNCLLRTADMEAIRTPIPFALNGKRYSIIYPDNKRRLPVQYGKSFRLSCVTSQFASPEFQNVDEVLVRCAGGDRLLLGGKTYKYQDFVCVDIPRTELRLTGETCQPEKYTVAEVGFRTKNAFLSLYKVCFDKLAKNSLYTWYVTRSPYYNNYQLTDKRPLFITSPKLYGNTNMNIKYTIGVQRKTIKTILGSQELAAKFIQNDFRHYLARGHYAAKADFFFGSEQWATFYYVNVAPQWQIFNQKLWNELEMTIRSRLADKTNEAEFGVGRRLIVTGSYGSCTLPDVNGTQRPLFLDPPSGIPVPLFFWKLVYDRRDRDGVVYIGLNNPYQEYDDDLFLCPNTCPGGYRNNGATGQEEEPDLRWTIHCCTKESFELFYLKLDDIVYQNLE